MSQESSTGPLSDSLPSEVRGWNWGAFFLNWIWGIGNGTWIGLLMFVPLVNLVVPFVMGSQGNRWAWENRRWESADQFKRAQRIWALAGLAVWVLLGAAFVSRCDRVRPGLQGSMVYREAILHLEASPKVHDAIGKPLEVAPPLGRQLDSAGGGWATLSFPVRGPGGKGVVSATAHRREGDWLFDTLELELEPSGTRIDLLRSESRSNGSP